jgi:protoporphyrinogen oxidase
MRGILKGSQNVVILGAGPTGLGAAFRLKELGHSQFQIYERASHVGGLASSFTDARGFTWDIGGHVQFSHYRYFDDLMERALGDSWIEHQRESWVWFENRFVPYPFQNNLRYLHPETRWRCLQGLIQLYKNPPAKHPANFREWIDLTFGKGLADVFMVPYNFKVWAHPAEEMDYNWIGERVAVVDLEKVLDNVLHEKDDVSWGPNNTFRFPRCGGTGAIWERVADLIGRESISLGKEATGIDRGTGRVYFSDGTYACYDVLISTLPIDRLVQLLGLDQLDNAVARLKHSASNIVGIGLSGYPPDALRKKCWMYFPENECPFYRVTVFSNYSPNNVPDASAQWSLMAEISESPHKPVDRDRLTADTIRAMYAAKLIDDSHEVLSKWTYRTAYGYPIPTLGRDGVLSTIHSELEGHRIFSRGRFGGWKYEVSNQDHSLMQGVELVDRLLLGVPEVTYWFPNTANNTRYAKFI